MTDTLFRPDCFTKLHQQNAERTEAVRKVYEEKRG